MRGNRRDAEMEQCKKNDARPNEEHDETTVEEKNITTNSKDQKQEGKLL